MISFLKEKIGEHGNINSFINEFWIRKNSSVINKQTKGFIV